MPSPDTKPLYRHTGVALLRSAVSSVTHAPDWWPDPSDTEACRLWLDEMWSRPDLADAIRQASPTLARRVDAIGAGHTLQAKQIRRAAVATSRYLLRATGRPTPFGLFAGVAPVALARTAQVRWGTAHRAVARADTEWLAAVIDRLEACPELLERLDVAFGNLALRRGRRLEAPHGPDRVRIRYTSAVQAVRDAAASPVQFRALADKLAENFGADRSTVTDMLTELVHQGFLITCLRAPFTTIDPLAHVVDRLHEAEAESLPSVASLHGRLEAVRAEVHRHNQEVSWGKQGQTRATITSRIREISPAGRTPLAVDLLLDCNVSLPEDVASEIQRAASALLRLTRHPAGLPAWRDYHGGFCDRYGTGTLAPVTEVVDPDAGLGYPAGYPGSILPAPTDGSSERDEHLLALAWQATTEGSGEVVLTEETIRALAREAPFDERRIPPHVEVAARIHAKSVQALERGEYTLIVAPARAGGTLTSRFTPTATGSGLESVYRALPVAMQGALPVQMSFPPAYPHAGNICRIPAYLPHVLCLGEHRSAGDEGAIIPVGDLAITATRDRLHLVSISRRRVVEPQVFHALALDKQGPPLARFLAHLPRAFAAAWTVLDWGPSADRLAYLPRVRYRRSVLAPARWRLTADDLPYGKAGQEEWQQALDRWRDRWGCPGTVDLRDDDRTLLLVLDEQIHAAILRTHLARHGHATLTEATGPAELGWIAGHAHEIALPMVTTRPAACCPLAGPLPAVTNSTHGQLPGSPDAAWLYAKIHTHPERHDEIIAERLPELLATLGESPRWWFVRYRSPFETDHLRLRLRIPDHELYGAYAVAVGSWAHGLRRAGLARRLVFDSYQPEIGRYGSGPAMDAAEEVFVGDSRAVAAGLRQLPAAVIDPMTLAAVSMVDIVSGFLGADRAMNWLVARPAPATTAADRTVADQAIRLTRGGSLQDLPGWQGEVAEAWQARAAALAAYRNRLPAGTDTNTVLESLLHMHHNRAVGIDPDAEKTCRRLARQTALASRAQRAGHDR
jgi:thiopeptide-type bacteriocin biosynthesis protein